MVASGLMINYIFYYLLNKANSWLNPTFSLPTLFLLSLLLCGSRFLKKTNSFLGLKSPCLFKSRSSNYIKILAFNPTPDIDSKDEVVVQCNVSVAKILL